MEWFHFCLRGVLSSKHPGIKNRIFLAVVKSASFRGGSVSCGKPADIPPHRLLGQWQAKLFVEWHRDECHSFPNVHRHQLLASTCEQSQARVWHRSSSGKMFTHGGCSSRGAWTTHQTITSPTRHHYPVEVTEQTSRCPMHRTLSPNHTVSVTTD